MRVRRRLQASEWPFVIIIVVRFLFNWSPVGGMLFVVSCLLLFYFYYLPGDDDDSLFSSELRTTALCWYLFTHTIVTCHFKINGDCLILLFLISVMGLAICQNWFRVLGFRV